jgi:pyruvate/2-oxoglutarate dehydrogenase complex dihydrolipoamide dehydrogenase (E3) component
VLQAAESREILKSNGCDLFIGTAVLGKANSNENKTTVRVCRPTECVELESDHVCIATGSRANRPKELKPGVPFPFTKGRVICS